MSTDTNEQITVQSIIDAIAGLEYGTLEITIHGGQIVQIDRTEKKRFPLKKELTK